jgi:hypothetical protein
MKINSIIFQISKNKIKIEYIYLYTLLIHFYTYTFILIHFYTYTLLYLFTYIYKILFINMLDFLPNAIEDIIFNYKTGVETHEKYKNCLCELKEVSKQREKNIEYYLALNDDINELWCLRDYPNGSYSHIVLEEVSRCDTHYFNYIVTEEYFAENE